MKAGVSPYINIINVKRKLSAMLLIRCSKQHGNRERVKTGLILISTRINLFLNIFKWIQ